MNTTPANLLLGSNADEILMRIGTEKTTVVTTEDGEAVAYLVDAKKYEEDSRELRILKGLAEGEQDIAEGKVHSHQDVLKMISAWYK